MLRKLRLLLPVLFVTMLTLTLLLNRPISAAPSAAVLDGVRDGDYGAALTTDPTGDLASPGPADWTGTAWSDLTAIYCTNDNTNVYVYVDSVNYNQAASSGQVGLLVNFGNSSNGSADPWGNDIVFGHADKPDFVIRGNIPGIDVDPFLDNGWTELRTWAGTDWSDGGTNWGGITGSGQIGTHIAYANGAGIEFKIPVATLGVADDDAIGLQFFTTQAGTLKGAYDTLPTDDQSTGWDDGVSLSNYATCTIDIDNSITPSPTPTEDPTLIGEWEWPNKTTMVHLFEWKWSDIALECENWLGPKGFEAVQVSPPMEHRVVAPGYPWWQRYQPTSYVLTSRSGDETAFANMVDRCNAVGVEIYVDAVINHMNGLSTGGSAVGSAGTMITDQGGTANYPTDPGLFSSHAAPAPDHFNYDDCSTGIIDWCDRDQVTQCELLGLDDLDTSLAYVQDEIADYLNHLIDLGVSGFRIDAAKHIKESELEAIVDKLDGDPYIFLEVIQDAGCGFDGSTYIATGDVTEFGYGFKMANAFSGNNIAALNGIESGLLNSADSVTFIDNHDTQREYGSSSLVPTYNWGNAYTLANVMMLGYPYGHIKVMSSYDFPNDGAASSKDQSPPFTGTGITEDIYTGTGVDDVNCVHAGVNDKWICEHRWLPIANMVGFRNMTEGESLVNWRADTNQRIAFSRGDVGFMAVNNQANNWSTTFATNLPAGTYCNITVSNILVGGVCENISSSATEGPLEIVVDGSGNATIDIPPFRSIAIHTGQPDPSVPAATTLSQVDIISGGWGAATWILVVLLLSLISGFTVLAFTRKPKRLN